MRRGIGTVAEPPASPNTQPCGMETDNMDETKNEFQKVMVDEYDEMQEEPVDLRTEKMYCANHPDVETLLRCNKCNKPICMKCAVQTPVGYRCVDCVRAQQNVYYNAGGADNWIGLGVAFAVTVIATPILAFVFRMMPGFFGFLIAFFAGSAAGSGLAQIVRRAVQRRRGRNLRWFVLAGTILGLLVGCVVSLLLLGVFPIYLIPFWIFAVLAIVSALPFLR